MVDTQKPPVRQTGVVEAVGGVLVGAWAGSWWAAVAAFLALYLLGCWIWPRRMCPRCRGSKTRSDGRGNLRDRSCRRCDGAGTIRRLGAYAFGWGSRDDDED